MKHLYKVYRLMKSATSMSINGFSKTVGIHEFLTEITDVKF